MYHCEPKAVVPLIAQQIDIVALGKNVKKHALKNYRASYDTYTAFEDGLTGSTVYINMIESLSSSEFASDKTIIHGLVVSMNFCVFCCIMSR